MVHNKDRYKVGSYCARCLHLTPEPSNIIWNLAVAIAPNPDIDRHPEIKIGRVYYDEKGWKHTILTRLGITRLDRRKRVFCEKCGKQCRAVPLSKKKKTREYIPSDNPVGRPKVTDKIKEEEEKEIDRYVDIIKKSRNTMFEVTLEEIPPRHYSKVKRRLDKEDETKTSNTNGH